MAIQSIPLWNGKIPNHIESDELETAASIAVFTGITNIQIPELQIFLADKPVSSAAVLIIPGGGYEVLLTDNEGKQIAEWLNSHGLNAFVLKHRLPNSKSITNKHEVPLKDAKRAMRQIRQNASAWKIDAEQIILMGFSAGGHLASSLNNHFDMGDENSSDPIERQSCRPNFSVLVYPVTTFTESFSYTRMRDLLLGGKPDTDLVKYFSTELTVTERNPQTLLVHCNDDPFVPVENSIVYYDALREKNVEVEMHLYPEGGHGFALAEDNPYLQKWKDNCIHWILNKIKHQ
ncbi:alpha/beta hydrolase [uncultured Croceitalea sp.]|uniref:alpha/beta hydrolase n=1 Tax=uncultured Croceitalea sp. TaxID=1798908 RepID=UPI0033060D0F